MIWTCVALSDIQAGDGTPRRVQFFQRQQDVLVSEPLAALSAIFGKTADKKHKSCRKCSHSAEYVFMGWAAIL